MKSEVFYTVISGTSIFVIGQLLQKFILEPIQQYKKTVGAIDNKLKYYANVLVNKDFSSETIREITREMRTLSCDLESEYKQIPFNTVISTLRLIERKKAVAKAAKHLIFLSNAGGRSGDDVIKREKAIKKIRKLLKVELLN